MTELGEPLAVGYDVTKKARTLTAIVLVTLTFHLIKPQMARSREVSDDQGGNRKALSISRKIDAKLRSKKIGKTTDLCDDATFLRRLTLDLTGTIPTAAAVDRFLIDSSPSKRQRAINRLLDTDAFSDLQARLWYDILYGPENPTNVRAGGKALQPNVLASATDDFKKWMAEQIAQ